MSLTTFYNTSTHTLLRCLGVVALLSEVFISESAVCYVSAQNTASVPQAQVKLTVYELDAGITFVKRIISL